ncbi:histone-lysine N-methyltransferase SETMAR [Trichonephila clavipes]|nr:histone-lysine N-methyltransferase SETMAR [Trichonephila clavipes]
MDFLEVGNIDATQYCDTLLKLKETIRKKLPGFLKYDVLLLDDNARPHSVTAMQNHIITLGWKCLHHQPYNLDLKQSDFHLFPALKNLMEAMMKSNKPLNASSVCKALNFS